MFINVGGVDNADLKYVGVSVLLIASKYEEI